MEQTKRFKCKDEVIYRRTDERSEWTYGIFSHYYDYNNFEGFVVDGHFLLSTVHQILPYEGNEELVGTTDEPEERLNLGEVCIFFEDIESFEGVKDLIVDKVSFKDCTEDAFWQSGEPNLWKYCIRFSDFNPEDMEATRAKILCVRNGKIVKYKG